jgi:hypothetical protein
MDKLDLVRSVSQFAESRFPLKYSHCPLVETKLFKVWQKFFVVNGWRSCGG